MWRAIIVYALKGRKRGRYIVNVCLVTNIEVRFCKCVEWSFVRMDVGIRENCLDIGSYGGL